jgi:hypothetical protein
LDEHASAAAATIAASTVTSGTPPDFSGNCSIADTVATTGATAVATTGPTHYRILRLHHNARLLVQRRGHHRDDERRVELLCTLYRSQREHGCLHIFQPLLWVRASPDNRLSSDERLARAVRVLERYASATATAVVTDTGVTSDSFCTATAATAVTAATAATAVTIFITTRIAYRTRRRRTALRALPTACAAQFLVQQPCRSASLHLRRGVVLYALLRDVEPDQYYCRVYVLHVILRMH